MIELEEWLGFLAHNRNLAERTCSNYRHVLRAHGAWLSEKNLTPALATPEILQEYSGGVLHGRGLSPASRRIAVSALRGYYAWLLGQRVVNRDPAAALPYPRLGTRLPLPIQAAAAEKLMAQPDLETFKGVRDVAIMGVLLGCGPRIGGVVSLNEGDLVFAVNEHGIEELTLRLCEKGGKERYVPAPDETRLLLRAYLGHPELEEIDRRLPDGDQVLFVNMGNSSVPESERRGEARRIGRWSIWDMIQTYGREVGIDPKQLHPHAFRHFYGQELAEGDVDVLTRQKLMGHTDPKHTEKYSHIAYRKLRKAAIDANPMKRIKTPATGLAAALKAGGPRGPLLP